MTSSSDGLRSVPFFRELTDEEFSRVEQIAIPRFFRRKTSIFVEGEPKEAVFFIKEGLVKAFKTDENGHEQIVSFLKTGHMFPHTGFFDHSQYPATTEAMTDTRVLAIPLKQFEQLMLSHPTIGVKVMKVMGDKIRELQEKLQTVTGQDVQDRGLTFLLHLAEMFGEKKGNVVRIDLPITHQEFANSIGTTRETVNRLFSLLRKENLLEIERNRFIITDLAALVERAASKR